MLTPARRASKGRLTLGAKRFTVQGLFYDRVVAWPDVVAFEVRMVSLGRGGQAPFVYCRFHEMPGTAGEAAARVAWPPRKRRDGTIAAPWGNCAWTPAS